MSSNKKTREEMIELFGDKCWIDKLDLRARSLTGEYTGRSVRKAKEEQKLVYHHIIMKKDGGKSTISNGALMSEDNHEWFHRQKQWRQDIMNEYLQQYKINCILANFDDDMAIHVTKAQIDFAELDEENYFILEYDQELDELDKEIFKKAKEKRDTLKEWEER